ncbi:helix-turn-helix domain-containing protein [Virgisporangium aurantiacum]|uniref:Transcriptional regulator n=1 Tax=Virgisporangium aurantiacum TaxID=175570 RepID=A0A8J3YXP5_9ACTN|nr:helix-turn-helix transcriptional regulator [Virgisporangium aurantiacum]GIJ53914.1 transcriptional regulator [Virgisporangium aurantiacum]
MVSGSVGERIAAYRRRRGLSQAALAGLVGRSESWLSQVERGVRSVDRLSVLLDMAKLLHVEVEALIGRPWRYAPNGGAVLDGIDEVRTFFSRYDSLLDVGPEEPIALEDFRAQVIGTHEAYQAARYQEVVAGLPALLSSADAVHRTAAGDTRREALHEYVSAYTVTAKLLTKMGVNDLALLAADRCATAAVDADSLSARGMAAYQVVCALMRNDRIEDAERLAVSMAELVQRQAGPGKPTLLSVGGALWLASAIAAARRTDRPEADRRLDIASGLATTLGEDGNFAWTAFGPTNVALHRAAVAAELGDPGEVDRVSEDIDPARLPVGLSGRRSQIHVDLAWANVQRKRDADALLHLLEAEEIAPEAVRYNSRVGELVREMLARQKKSKTSALHKLAVRAGVLD